MYEIEMTPPSEDFTDAWVAAGRHLSWYARKHGYEPFFWRQHLEPPFLEHHSFRLGNQLFFVRLDGVDGPGNEDGLRRIAEGCGGHACRLPMEQRNGNWVPKYAGWGLQQLDLPRSVNPPELMTPEPVEMSDWELQDFAVQCVRQSLEAEGRRIMSSQGHPRVNPSLWFVGDEGPEWVVVRAARYPMLTALPPDNILEIDEQLADKAVRGLFASVAFRSEEVGYDPSFLIRGTAIDVEFAGLVPIGE